MRKCNTCFYLKVQSKISENPPLQIQNVRFNVFCMGKETLIGTKTYLSKRFFNAVTKPAAKPYPTKWGRYMDQIIP